MKLVSVWKSAVSRIASKPSYTGKKIQGDVAAILPSLAISASLSIFVYFFTDTNQTYTDFIVGNLAYQNGSKNQDFAGIFSFVVLVPILFFILSKLNAKSLEINGSLPNGIGLNAFFNWAGLALALWLGVVAVSPSSGLFLPFIYVYSVTSASFLIFVLRPHGHAGKTEINAGLTFPIYVNWIFSPILAAFSMIGFYLLGTRLLGLNFELQNFEKLAIIASSLVFFLQVLVARKTSLSQTFTQNLEKIRIWSSFGLPLIVLGIIPGQVIIEGEISKLVQDTILLRVVACCLVVVGLAALALSLRSGHRVKSLYFERVIAFIPLIGLLVLFRLQASGPTTISSDDYHFGESALPWMSLTNFGQLPFVDFEPARGLVNYVPGALTAVFFENNLGSFNYSNSVLTLILAIVFGLISLIYLPNSMVIPILTLYPIGHGVSGIDLVITCALILVALTTRVKNPVLAGVLSSSTFALAILYSPGQGGLLAAASITALVISFFRERLFLLIASFSALLTTTILLLAPVVGQIYLGAIRYGFDQSLANSTTYGIAWKGSIGAAGENVWLMELARSSFLLAPLALLGIYFYNRQATKINKETYFLAIAGVVLSILFVFKAFGRIDPGYSRMGLAGIWVFVLVIPLIAFRAMRGQFQLSVLAIWAAVVGMLLPGLNPGLMTDPPLAKLRQTLEVSQVSSAMSREMQRVANTWPVVGEQLIDETQERRMENVRTVTSKLLSENETYLDLSNRTANYAYVGKFTPIPTAAVYNITTESQRIRAISALQKHRPKLVLISNENITHDGGPLGLRTPELLAWLDEHQNSYRPAIYNGQIWLVDFEIAQEALEIQGLSWLTKNQYREEMEKVWTISNLQKIPSAWGDSWSSLSPSVSKFAVSPYFSKSGSVESAHFTIRSELRDKALSYLALRLGCQGGSSNTTVLGKVTFKGDQFVQEKEPHLQFDARDGLAVVPLYASTSWILERSKISEIEVSFESTPNCSSSILSEAFFAVK